ncbi:hypothetical protein A3Q56_01658 [Intoshia linei]|uniref:Uncharacterized protein n=1 Tax=Intoshia linei TaxID=1819745 RepID=A0A177B8S9_9BILA|nr:hypothetical protein A3Q56_01658 [Intoshia linei]
MHQVLGVSIENSMSYVATIFTTARMIYAVSYANLKNSVSQENSKETYIKCFKELFYYETSICGFFGPIYNYQQFLSLNVPSKSHYNVLAIVEGSFLYISVQTLIILINPVKNLNYLLFNSSLFYKIGYMLVMSYLMQIRIYSGFLFGEISMNLCGIPVYKKNKLYLEKNKNHWIRGKGLETVEYANTIMDILLYIQKEQLV